MAHWFYKIQLEEKLELISSEIESQKSSLIWHENIESGQHYAGLMDGRHHNGQHGTQWCELQLSEDSVSILEKKVGHPIFKSLFYLWNYGSVKELPIHIDRPEINYGNAISGILPLEGTFDLKVYENIDDKKPVDSCIYGPGDIVLLNNLDYYHKGEVLSGQKVGLHFFLDLKIFDSPTIEDILKT